MTSILTAYVRPGVSGERDDEMVPQRFGLSAAEAVEAVREANRMRAT